MDTDRPGILPKSYFWSGFLLVLGVLLILFALLVLVTDVPIGWFAAGLALSPWGPICLIVAALLARHVRKVNRLVQFGITARAQVTSINSTGSRVGGLAVLRLGMSVIVDDMPAYPVTVRNAPPYHLVSMLRPGVSIPVVVDPDYPERVVIDWKKAEWETSPESSSGF